MTGNEWKDRPAHERDKERDPFWYTRMISIWCYACGMIWLNRRASELYERYSRCNICGGLTDGVQE